MALNDRTSSFGLVRTNPKISGNVKITVDSQGEIWLNTINANKELSSSDLKRYRITRTSTYEGDLKNFIGKLPPEIVFEVKKGVDPTATSNTFQNQFDFFYAMGATPLVSDAYSEDYSYFAPLWLRDQLPQYFVIFRVTEPLDFPYNEGVTSIDVTPAMMNSPQYRVLGDDDYEVLYENQLYHNGDVFTSNVSTTFTVNAGTGKVVKLDEGKDLPIDYPELFNQIIRKAEVVETFDLSENSKIGKYIRSIQNGRGFPQSPITARFEKDLLTTWNGVDYRSGAMVSKGEFLDTYWANSQNQIDFEEYVTGGFERHGIICPFMLNMEFLFSDETADLYTIPRYFGFYVNQVDIGTFQLSGDLLYDMRNTSGNSPAPKRSNRGYSYQETDFFQNNDNGVRLFYENESGNIPSSTWFELGSPAYSLPRSYYVQDKNGKFYSLNQRPELYVDGEYNTTTNDLVVRNTSVNLSDFTGPYKIKSQGSGALLPEKGRSYLQIKILDSLLPGDTIRLYWNIGTQTDSDGPYDEITANDLRRYFTVPAGGTTLAIYGDYTSVYSNGDDIEIVYDSQNYIARTITSAPTYLGGYTTFSINTAINSVAVDGYITIEPGWGPGSHLTAESYNPIYFHPYGTASEIASAIASAFNSLEQRTFDAIAMNDTVVIRMRAGQLITNQFFGKFNLTLPENVEAQESNVGDDPTAKYYFRGGTDSAKIRLRVALEDREKLSTGDIYIKTKLGVSRITNVDRYMDEAVQEAGDSDIASLGGFDDYAVCIIENTADEPTLGTTNQYIAYTLYRVPVGLFSFFNIKDIDGDFWSSNYNRSPIHEYKRYFDLPAGEDVLVIGRTYYVMGGDMVASITHDGNTYTAPASFVATATSFEVTEGSPFVVAKIFFQGSYVESDLLEPGTYEVLGDPIMDSIHLINDNSNHQAGTTFTITSSDSFVYYTGTPTVIKSTVSADWLSNIDLELKSFPGFSKLVDFLTIEEENQDKSAIEFILRDKFSFNEIQSEYDYLKENFNKDLATKSRLIQYVSKWVYSGGTDVRDNPYRLNTHPVFGPFNFSPSFDIKTQNPEGFSHEWYYLEGAPHQYPSTFDADNYYFFPDTLDFDALTDCSPSSQDYFAEYFTFQPTSDSPIQERYTIFDFNANIGLCETFFRGAKIRIKEIIRDTQAQELQGTKPPFKNGSTTFDGYKFTSLLRVHKESRGIVESPVQIQIVENKTTKTITMLVDVIIEDYRTLNLANPDELGSIMSPAFSYPDTLDSSVDYLLLYSLKSKKKEATWLDSSDYFENGLDLNKIADIKLSVSLDLSSPSGASGPYTYVNAIANPDYDWDLRDEVHSFHPSNYMSGEYAYGDTLFPNAQAVTQTQVLFGIPGVSGYPSYPSVGSPYPNDFLAPEPSTIYIPSGSQFEWADFATYINAGGKLYYEPIMQRISFGRMADKVNQYSDIIKYRSFEYNGFNTSEVEPNFYIEFVEPATIMKVNSLIPVPDDDRPQELQTEDVIGVNIQQVNSAQVMRRYSGPYEPKFRNIFYFKDQTSDEIIESGTDLSFLQATFNPDVDGFGLIKNFGYLKVANTDILSLVNNLSYKSLYPLIHEIAVDKMDFPVYLSNWDPGFWRKFVNKQSYKPQAGTREMLEQKNFLATKIMKTPGTIQLQTFTKEEVATLDMINVGAFDNEVLYYQVFQDGDLVRVSGYINVEKRLLRYLIEDGASEQFENYLMPEFGVGDPDSIDDDVMEYLRLNVLPTYEIKEISPYVRVYKQNTLALPVIETSLTDAQKLQASYTIEKNTRFTKVSDFVYRFEYVIDVGYNVSIAPSIQIGKI